MDMGLKALLAAVLSVAVFGQANAAVDLPEVLRRLNDHSSVNVSDDAKSYRVLLDAYLEMTTPPWPIDDLFNLRTIHPNMSGWDRVADWAEANPHMSQALKEAKERTVFGLQYGQNAVPAAYQDAELYVTISIDDVRVGPRFPYLEAIKVIASYGTAEGYRLLEAGEVDEAMEVYASTIWVLRQCADRQFLGEKLPSIEMLSGLLGNLRDVFYVYMDEISPAQYTDISRNEIEWLRPTRDRLEMPEGDRIVAEAIIESVFVGDRADPQQFREVFGAIQASDAPLTRFGAARRWEMIAHVHAELQPTLDRLQLIYDDWWRRWRVQEYDPILDIPSEFDRTNRVRYGAVTFSAQDIEHLFDIRNVLVVQVNGTAMAAGLCAYRRTFNTYPSDQSMIYATFTRKVSDVDPYSRGYDPLRYRKIDGSRHAIDGPFGRVWAEPGECILYSRGPDLEDNQGRVHAVDVPDADIVIWPPVRALSREAGLVD